MESALIEMAPTAKLFVTGKQQIEDVCKSLKPFFNGLIIANNDLTPETGLKKMEEGTCDAVSFARLYITNPDLEWRIINGAPLDTNYDYSTFYGPNLEGVTKGFSEYPPFKK